MALSFLRHLKPETLKSRKKLPATETPLQTQRRLNDESPAVDPISAQYITVVDGQQRAEEEEKESGICTDSSSELSRRESDDSQDTDPEGASSLSTIEDLEGGRTVVPIEVPVEVHTVLSEGRLEDAASDISAYDVPESSADIEEECQNEPRSSCMDNDAVSVGHPWESSEHLSGSPEHHLEESLQHHSEERREYPEEDMTDDFNDLTPTPFPQLSEELSSEPETSSRTPPTLSSSTLQHGDDIADDAVSYLSTTRRQDLVTEPDAISNSRSSRISCSEDVDSSIHSLESSEISISTITECSTIPPVLPPPAPPPPPPPLGLLLPGDHTTSSTTDVLPTSTSVSAHEAKAAAVASGLDRDEGTEDELMRQIKAAARKMSNHRETLSHLDQGSLPNAKPTQFSESFTSDLKSVIASRQSRIGSFQVNDGEIPGKITFYKSRIGIPPEDTELCRVFLKRAAKSGTLEHPRDGGFADERPAPCVKVLGSGASALPIMTTDNRNSSARDTKHFDVTSYDENNFDAGVVGEVSEQNTSAVEDVSCTVGTHEEMEDTQQIVTKEIPWQNESEDRAVNFHSTMVQNSDFEQGAEFDKVVEDFDQFLEENTLGDSWREPSETPSPLEGQIQSSPVFELTDSDVEIRSGDIGTSGPEFTNGTSENSSSFSPNLSTFSEAESPVFEEMDDLAISTSAQTVQERSKLLAQPLESYNILPTFEKISTKSEPKSRFSFRNIVASLRNTLGRKKQNNSEEGKTFSFADGSQMKFDDNWSIHDTLTQRGNTLPDSNKNKSRSLRDVFVNPEFRSLSEFSDPDKNSGKDFSVRNWKEVMERSKVNVQNISETLDTGNPETVTEIAGFSGLLTKRAMSSPNLGSISDTKYFSQIEKQQCTAKSSHAGKKRRSSSSKMEELTTPSASMESSSRHASSSLNSTLPSRHLHGMMQSFGSIYPGSQTLNQKHYQKKSEPRQYSLPSKGTAGLLSPVQRRKQRSQQAKR